MSYLRASGVPTDISDKENVSPVPEGTTRVYLVEVRQPFSRLCYLLLSCHIHQLHSIIPSSLPHIQTILDMKNFGRRVTLDLEGLQVDDLHSIIE
jgi:hypothetical protein